MSEPYIGEIRMVGFNFAPNGWAMCNGALMAISQNEALFNLIGTTYGGDGQQTFALPNLQGRIPYHAGNGMVWGQLSGSESVTLISSQMPAHSHSLAANSGIGSQASPAGAVYAASPLEEFSSGAGGLSMDPRAISSSGNNEPHDNLPPYLVITFVISLFGVFPSQN